MSELKAEVDPAEVGLDAERLGRIDGTFARYVDDGRLVASYLVTVSRHGKLAHVSSYGARDRDEGLPVDRTPSGRIFSMTKPITSVADAVYEEGALQLTDPVSKFIPSFASLRVQAAPTRDPLSAVPATEPMRVWHLLTHTSGLTYGFHRVHTVDAIYRRGRLRPGPRAWTWRPRAWLGRAPAAVRAGRGGTTAFRPTYSARRVVEVGTSGQSLDEFFADRGSSARSA